MKRFSPQDVPSSPGVYVFRNASGDVIYVGKARSLRKRLGSYFQPSRRARADAKLRALLNSIDSYEVYTVTSEGEALLLESRMIKEYRPRYNVELRDDKRFLYICVDLTESFPRLRLTRIRKEDGRIYFGPFPRAGVLRATVTFLARRFQLRTCRPRHPDASTRRHCLKRVFQHCCCPCVGEVTAEQYGERLEQALNILRGETAEAIAELTKQMEGFAADLKFEQAAGVRDMIDNLRFVCDPTRRNFARAKLDPGAVPNAAVDALREALGLQNKPEVIDCFDISNIGGHMAVGSVVCFRSGKPARKEYRRFRVKTEGAEDDTARMHEVVFRRLARLLSEGRGGPDLIVIDGGRGQLNAAIKALSQAGMAPLPVLSLAKKREEVYLPGRTDPLVLPRDNAGLKLLQAVRDEAHRFALAYHRDLRRKRIADSILNEVEGIGPRRREQLLRHFGSARKLRRASPEEIAAAVPGLGPKLAARLHEFLEQHHRAGNMDTS